MTFEEWKLDLESRRLESKFAAYGGATEKFDIIKTNNIRMFDRQLKVLSVLGHECAHCRWPLPARDNFAIYLYGNVCVTCYDIHSILSRSAYFVAVAQQENDKKKPRGFGGWFADPDKEEPK